MAYKFSPLASFPPGTLLLGRKSPPPPPPIRLYPVSISSAVPLQKTQLPIPLPVILPKHVPTKPINGVEEEVERSYNGLPYEDTDFLMVTFPCLSFSNILFFNSAYNVQVIVGDDEPEDNLISRFRREVLIAGVLQESKRRRFFESSQEKRKRKTRDAARRNRKRRPQPKVSKQVKEETPKKMKDSEEDNWESLDIDLPYC